MIVLGSHLSEVRAGGGPENLLLVVNNESDSSKLIANHYISLRNIPGRNVIYLDGIPFKEKTDFKTFESKILRPVLNAVEDRKLVGSIDYIVYSSDFPTTVTIPDALERYAERAKAQGIKWAQEKKIYYPSASINSLTYLAGACIHQPSDVLSMQVNKYYRIPTSQMLLRPFRGPNQKEFERSVDAFEKPSDDPLFESANSSMLRLAKENPGQTALLYWLAKFAAKQGDETKATRYMTRAIAMGWSNRTGTVADPDFAAISDPVFNGIVRRMKNYGRHEIASRAFRQVYQWAPNGMHNRTAGEGSRYFLSTVLAVTRNDGNSEAEAVRQLQRTVKADFSNPLGTFYFSHTDDDRSKTRRGKFKSTVNTLQDLGFQAKIIKEALPQSQTDVLGLCTGKADFSWEKSGSSIVPGAICENLTSYGGRLGDTRGQTPLNEFLRYGAAGSSGTVIEPYTIPEKFPSPMIQVHYARGCSLAEAFYQSIHGPFQTLIVGDALCQPFAKPPQVGVSGISPMETVTGKKQLVFDHQGSPVRIAGMELYVDGGLQKRDRSLDPIDFDSALLSDGYHEIRVVFVAANQIETSCRSIIPILVNNNQQSCQLTATNPACGIDDTIKLSIIADGATQIRLVQHEKLLTTIEGSEGSFDLKARDLGRGPSQIRAIATISEKEVSSQPLDITVNGPLLETKVRTKKSPADK